MALIFFQILRKNDKFYVNSYIKKLKKEGNELISSLNAWIDERDRIKTDPFVETTSVASDIQIHRQTFWRPFDDNLAQMLAIYIYITPSEYNLFISYNTQITYKFFLKLTKKQIHRQTRHI